jgi:hypothetical protein
MRALPAALDTVLAQLSDATVITVEDFARIVGISRSAAYEAARRGDFPVRRVGRRLVVPVPALRRWLGVDPDSTEPAASQSDSSEVG